VHTPLPRVSGDGINHLVDVYPQPVGCRVDNFALHVNDSAQLPSVHIFVTRLWSNPSGRPQAWALSVRGSRWLSPQSTDAMTTDELSYFRMANCTSISKTRSVDTHPAGQLTKIEEYR
jgi:hypothetical protein